MSLDTLKSRIPDYAKDIKLNLSTLAGEETLSKQQLWGTFLASALAGRNTTVIRDIAAEAAQHLSPEAINGAKAAAAIMGMNNIYYKFLGLVGDSSYQTLPANLRMNIIANPGIDKMDFELWALAVSVINSCKGCINAHEHKLVEHGLTKAQVQTAVRIAAVVHAASQIMDGEEALAA